MWLLIVKFDMFVLSLVILLLNLWFRMYWFFRLVSGCGVLIGMNIGLVMYLCRLEL